MSRIDRINKLKNIGDKIIIPLFSICLFFIIIFGSMNMMIFNKEFYMKEYSKNGVYERLPPDIDAGKVTDNTLKYFRGTEDLAYFQGDEKSHMQDVRSRIRTMQYIYYTSAMLSIALFYYCYVRYNQDRLSFVRTLSKALIYSSIAAIAFLILIFLFAVFNFDLLFTLFHVAFFSGNWTFPETSLLIILFPQQFFFDISLRIFIFAMFQSLIFFGIGFWMRKQLKMHDRYHH